MKNLMITLKIFLVLTVITGLIYPMAITGYAQLFYENKANGSLIIKNNKIVGSGLIGQQFSKPDFFWGRPSAIGYNPMPSGGSNFNPVGEILKTQVQARVDTIRKYYGNVDISSIPKDLLFSSASGVDPHISPEAAYFQVERIANYRHFSSIQINKLKNMIESSIEKPEFFILGEFRINVLELNLKLAGI